MLKLSHNTVM